MTDVQLENGYTRIATELLEAICKTDLSGQEMRVLLFIIRKTYGYNKKEDHISSGQISKETLLTSQRAKETTIKLQKRNILIVTEKSNGKTNKYMINKDYSSWKRLSTGIENYTGIEKHTRIENYTTPVLKTIPVPVYKTIPTINNTIDNIINKGDVPIKPIKSKPPLTHIQEVVEHYKLTKGYCDDPEWDKQHYKRHVAPAKMLFDYWKDIELCKKCISWLSKQSYEWTLETAFKKSPDYKKLLKGVTSW
jgi:phage replication O-like protein O